MISWETFLKFKPDREKRDYVRRAILPKLRGVLTQGEAAQASSFSLGEVACAGLDYDGLLWLAQEAAKRDQDSMRRLCLWATDCAARVHKKNKDGRVVAAIVAARECVAGAINANAASASAYASSAAASAANAAASAANAAANAASAAYAAAYAGENYLLPFVKQALKLCAKGNA